MTTLRISMTALVFAAALACSACGTSTYTDKNGNVTTVDMGRHTVTYKDKTGVHTIADSVDARKLGIPLYPGANVASGSGFHVGQATRGGDVALLTSSDAFDKVLAWYEKNLPKSAVRQNVLTTPLASEATFTFVDAKDKLKRAVVIAGTAHKTTITVTAGT